MKKIFILFILVNSLILNAQVPEGFNYQAAVRNRSGEIVANQPVRFKFSILQNSATGTSIYVETQSATTNDFGLATLVIGKGSKLSGDLDPSGWGNNIHFLKVEIDPTNGNSFRHLGTTQLMAVPYAFHAQTVKDDNVNDADADPENELQELEINGNELGITQSTKTITLPLSGGGDDWGSQTVETDVTLDGKGTSASLLKIAQQGATSGQVLKWSGSNWTPGDINGVTSLWQQKGDDIYYNTGKVSIGTSDPEFKLTIENDGGIIAKGQYGSGATLTTVGQGARLIWYPKKAAFRAGWSFGTHWNDSNIGKYSVAIGESPIASGTGSTAIGSYTEASGVSSFSMGSQTIASGLLSTAIGQGIEVSGDRSIAIALDRSYGTIVTQNNTMAIMGGKVGIGTVAPGAALHVKQSGNGFQNGLRLERPDNTNWWSIQINNYNDLVFDYNGTSTRAWINHSTAAYQYSSDRRLKTDIHSIKSALSKVMQLNPVIFRFKTNPNSEKPSYGLIAQEVQKIYPEFVSENNGTLGIAYHNFSVINIRAIQEQQEQIGLMVKQIENLVNQNNELKDNNELIINKLEKLETQYKELQSHILLSKNN